MSDSVLLHVFGNVTKPWHISSTDVDVTTLLTRLQVISVTTSVRHIVGFLRKEAIITQIKSTCHMGKQRRVYYKNS